MELFDFIKVLFEKPAEWPKVTNYEKSKFFFMLNRICSIQYPVQANMFNNIKVSKTDVADYWQENLRKIFKRTPEWVWPKKKAEAKTAKLKKPSAEAIQMYLSRYDMSERELTESIKLFGADQTYAPIKQLEKMISD